LGIARIAYAKFGKNISRVLLISMSGAAVCYLIAGLSSGVTLAFVACILTGFCTSMLWPGALMLMEEKVPGCGVAAFALMAAGGDLGASIAPQLMGIVIDEVSVSSLAARLALTTGLSPEQIGLKAGMLVSSLFPILGTIALMITIRYFKKRTFLT
jgi:MFS family permease